MDMNTMEYIWRPIQSMPKNKWRLLGFHRLEFCFPEVSQPKGVPPWVFYFPTLNWDRPVIRPCLVYHDSMTE